MRRCSTRIAAILADIPAADTFAVPEGLADTLRTTIAGTTMPWDAALWEIAWAAIKAQRAEADVDGDA